LKTIIKEITNKNQFPFHREASNTIKSKLKLFRAMIVGRTGRLVRKKISMLCGQSAELSMLCPVFPDTLRVYSEVGQCAFAMEIK
jgi:hypothetical protein